MLRGGGKTPPFLFIVVTRMFRKLQPMGEAPHEVYTDAEKKARAERVCGNCKFWTLRTTSPTNGIMGQCHNERVWDLADIDSVSKHFGCIHFEPK